MCPRRLSGPLLLLFLLGMVPGIRPLPAAAQVLPGHVFAAAGGTTGNATYRLEGTLGEPIAGHTASSTEGVYAGFWATAAVPAHTGTAVDDTAGDRPAAYRLDANYPNPFNPQTTLRYALPEPATVRLVVYDALGRVVQVLVDRPQTAGWHEVSFGGAMLPSGVYFYRLEAGAYQAVRSMLLVK